MSEKKPQNTESKVVINDNVGIEIAKLARKEKPHVGKNLEGNTLLEMPLPVQTLNAMRKIVNSNDSKYENSDWSSHKIEIAKRPYIMYDEEMELALAENPHTADSILRNPNSMEESKELAKEVVQGKAASRLLRAIFEAPHGTPVKLIK